MELSFWPKIALEVLLAGLTVLSIFYPYFGILAAIIAVILIVNEIGTRHSEGGDFKEKIVQEALAIVDHIVMTTGLDRISCSIWESKHEGFKKDMLGNNDYELWKQFYSAAQGRNQYRVSRAGWNYDTVVEFNRKIYDGFFRLYNGMPWVRELIPEEKIANIQMRAKHTASL